MSNHETKITRRFTNKLVDFIIVLGLKAERIVPTLGTSELA